MQGREFLDLARSIVGGATEAYWRGAVIHAYYAFFLECREAQRRWGFAPARLQAHADVRLRFYYATDADLRSMGQTLEVLGRFRNRGSYDLSAHPDFASDKKARLAIQDAADALALLDALDADPARRAVAIASIRP